MVSDIAYTRLTHLTIVTAGRCCRRYRLQNHPLMADSPAQQLLARIDTAENDYEARADKFGNAMLSSEVGVLRPPHSIKMGAT